MASDESNTDKMPAAEYVMTLLRRGIDKTKIIDELIKKGMDKEQAQYVLTVVIRIYKQQEEAAMIYRYIADLLAIDTSPEAIVESLISKGFKEKNADELVKGVLADIQKQQEVQRGFDYIKELYYEGKSEKEIIDYLIEKKLDEETAAKLARHIKEQILLENQFSELEDVIQENLSEGITEEEIIENLVQAGYYRKRVEQFLADIKERMRLDMLKRSIYKFIKEKFSQGLAEEQIVNELLKNGVPRLQAVETVEKVLAEYEDEKETQETIEGVRERIRNNKTQGEIISYLIERGLRPDEAKELLEYIKQKREEEHERGQILQEVKDMVLRGFSQEEILKFLHSKAVPKHYHDQIITIAKEELHREATAERVVLMIKESLAEGATSKDILENLVTRGAKRDLAEEVVSKIENEVSEKRAGKKVIQFIQQELASGKSAESVIEMLKQKKVGNEQLRSLVELIDQQMKSEYAIIKLIEKKHIDKEKLTDLADFLKHLELPAQASVILDYNRSANKAVPRDPILEGIRKMLKNNSESDVIGKLEKLGINNQLAHDFVNTVNDIEKNIKKKEDKIAELPKNKEDALETAKLWAEILRKYEMPYQAQVYDNLLVELQHQKPVVGSDDEEESPPPRTPRFGEPGGPSIYDIIRQLLASGYSIDYVVNFLVSHGFTRMQAKEIARYAMIEPI